MKRLKKLWQSLEEIPGLAALPAEWRDRCGDEFGLIEPYLRATENLGARHPCPHPRDADCPRRVVDYGDGSFSAICAHAYGLCSDIVLSPREATAHVLDIPSFARSIAEVLAIRYQPSPDGANGIWGLGLSGDHRTRNQPAFLLTFAREKDFIAGLRHLTVRLMTPFIVIAPTSRFVTTEIGEDLARQKCELVILADALRLSPSGSFVAVGDSVTAALHITPVSERQQSVQSYKERFGVTASRLYRAAGVHKSDFYKWIKGLLPDESEKAKRIEQALRGAPDLTEKKRCRRS